MKKKILISISIFIFVVTGVIFNYPRAIAVTEDVNINDINSDGFYYEQLTSELARSIYNGILSDVSGTGKFVVDTNLSFKVEGVTTENQDDELQELYDEKISPDLHDAFCAFILDHPEYYWIRYNGIDGTITPDFLYNMNEKTINITQLDMELYVLPQVENKAEFETKLKEVANSITGDNDYEILENIHNYIITNVSNESLNGEEIQQTAYGALMNNKASDEGASNLFTLLCREKGINSAIIRGDYVDGENTKMHQWSGVYIEDKWYAVDTDLDNIEDSKDFFMIGNNTKIGDKNFSEILIANIKPYDEQKTTFNEPILTNNQYEKFKVTVEYSTTETTKSGVFVTISANKEMNPVDGWELSEDRKYLQKEFFENIEGIVTLTSIYGERIDQEISINNIDNSPPSIEVKYSSTDLGATEVIVTIVSDRELQELDGWTLSEDRKTLTRTYNENTTETVIITDVLSNVVPVDIVINNIVSGAPECKVSYSTINKTNENVVVTITSNREMKELDGWLLSEDKKTFTKEFSENTNEDIELEDIYGNKTKAVIEINNIDKEKPELEITYSTKEPTNEKVKVYIKANEQISKPEGWEISADEYTISKYYFENESSTIKVEDLAGNEIEANIEINNIDKEKTICNVEYETSDTEVTVHIFTNEEIQPVDGWEITKDKKQITKTYTENKKEVIDIIDLAGNITETPVAVTTIVDKENNQTPYNEKDEFFSTIKQLPNAGKVTIIFLIVIAIVAVVIFYSKYKQYSRYNKFFKK